MEINKSRRSVIITGSSQGIGRGIAERLARDGLAVTLSDLPRAKDGLARLSQEITAAGGVSRVATGEVSDPGDVEALVAGHVEAFGGLDVMVANAGIAVTAYFIDTAPADLDRILAVNVRGVFNCYRTAADQMIKQGRGGRLIAAGSISAHRGSELQSAYVASKFAVRGLNQAVALELAKYGITANLYSPGATRTAMYESIEMAMSETTGTPRSDELARILADIPMGRMAVPDDIAKVVSFLASDDSGYVTGQSLVVSGGSLMV